MPELATKSDLKLAFDNFKLSLKVRLGGMIVTGFGLLGVLYWID